MLNTTKQEELTQKIIREKFTGLPKEHADLITDIIQISDALQAEVYKIINSDKTPSQELIDQRHENVTAYYQYKNSITESWGRSDKTHKITFEITTAITHLLSQTNTTEKLELREQKSTIYNEHNGQKTNKTTTFFESPISTFISKIKKLWFNSKNKITHRNKSPRHSEITEYLQEFKAHLLKVAANHNIEISE